MADNQITIELNKFLSSFPYFQNMGITEERLQSAYEGASGLISTYYGTIVLPENLQVRGVYLATAHYLYLEENPDIASNGKVSNASEGSVSAGFFQPPFKNWLEYYLSLTPYGTQLLAILSQIQPPMPRRPLGNYPYYQGGFNRV